MRLTVPAIILVATLFLSCAGEDDGADSFRRALNVQYAEDMAEWWRLVFGPDVNTINPDWEAFYGRLHEADPGAWLECPRPVTLAPDELRYVHGAIVTACRAAVEADLVRKRIRYDGFDDPVSDRRLSNASYGLHKTLWDLSVEWATRMIALCGGEAEESIPQPLDVPVYCP